MNNYERIKKMTVDEMAEWIKSEFGVSCKYCIHKPNGNYKTEECFKYKTCDIPVLSGLKQWLLKECE